MRRELGVRLSSSRVPDADRRPPRRGGMHPNVAAAYPTGLRDITLNSVCLLSGSYQEDYANGRGGREGRSSSADYNLYPFSTFFFLSLNNRGIHLLHSMCLPESDCFP